MACIAAAVRLRLGIGDDQVVESVAIDVAPCRNIVSAAFIVAKAGDVEALRGRHAAEVDVAGSAGFAEDHPGISRHAPPGADDHVVEAIAVDVAGAADRPAAPFRGRAGDLEALRGGEGGEIDVADAADLAVHHVRLAGGIPLCIPRTPGADNNVVDAIAVDITGGPYGQPAVVVLGCAGDDRPLISAEDGEIDIAQSTHLAIDHESLSGVGPAERVGAGRPEEEVGDAIAIEVAGLGDGRGDAADLESVGRGEGRQVDVVETAGFAVEDVGTAVAGNADHEIVDAVAVLIAGAADTDAGR